MPSCVRVWFRKNQKNCTTTIMSLCALYSYLRLTFHGRLPEAFCLRFAELLFSHLTRAKENNAHLFLKRHLCILSNVWGLSIEVLWNAENKKKTELFCMYKLSSRVCFCAHEKNTRINFPFKTFVVFFFCVFKRTSFLTLLGICYYFPNTSYKNIFLCPKLEFFKYTLCIGEYETISYSVWHWREQTHRLFCVVFLP